MREINILHLSIIKNMNSYKFALYGTFIVFLHSIQYFDWIKYNIYIGRIISFSLGVALFLYFVQAKKHIHLPYTKFIVGFTFIPFLSIIPCRIENGQSLTESLYVYMPFCFLLVYYLLARNKISEEDIVKWLTIFAVTRTAILIIEQFTYPTYWFAYRPEGYAADGHYYGIEIRSGIKRFYIMDTYLSMFLVFYYLQKLSSCIKLKYVLLFLYGLIGIYIDQQRQYMISTILTIVLFTMFSTKMKYKNVIVFLFCIVSLVIYIYSDQILGQILESVVEDTNEDNIRLFTYHTYGVEFFGGPLSYIFGNGFPAVSGSYAKSVSSLRSMGLTQTDIGIVGLYSYYGLTTLMFFIYFYIYSFRKYWHSLDSHIKMFIIASIINLPLFTMFSCHLDSYPFWGIMLYLADLSIIRNLNKVK